MTALFLVGDVRERMAELPGGSFDLILCSPPFLALRSYLPDGHPDKAREIGTEATPAEFLATLLELTAEWGRLLAPHGSIAVELGDTYAGSGGGGGDYYDGGLRAGQPGFTGSAAATRDALRDANARHWREKNARRDAWPLDKSLCGIPQAYQLSLAYGRNVLSGEESPAGMWRVRTLKPWIRSNPPVGALGDKERPATSYVVVATRARDRYFDLDAVRVGNPRADEVHRTTAKHRAPERGGGRETNDARPQNAAGAPPRDWWHHVDAVLDAELDARAGQTAQGGGAGPGRSTKLHGGAEGSHPIDKASTTVGARGVHLRRALERAGILRTLDALDVSPSGYSGAHYAVWPKELVRLLVDEMCPRRVCTTCGQPSRRITEAKTEQEGRWTAARTRPAPYTEGNGQTTGQPSYRTTHRALGWSDCGHDTWRPGRILDPFVGSGTTLEVATGMARDATGIDIDERNALLAAERVGMFLEIDQPTREAAS